MWAADTPSPAPLVPPVIYSDFWTILGALCLGAVIMWIIAVLFMTRRKPEKEPELTLEQKRTITDKYLAMIDEIETAYKAQETTSREAHQSLSLVLRGFASEKSGVRAEMMTLSDLREANLPSVAETVSHLYPGAFSRVADASVPEALKETRSEVSAWL